MAESSGSAGGGGGGVDARAAANAAYVERIEKRQPLRRPDYTNLWPIFLAPVIPLYGLVLKKYPRLRTALIGATAGGVLVYAHMHALGSSSQITGGGA